MSNDVVSLLNDSRDYLRSQLDKVDKEFFNKKIKDKNDLIEEIKTSYELGKNEAEEKLDKLISSVGKSVHTLPDKIRKAGDNIKNFSDSAADKTDDFIDSCENVQKNAKKELKDEFGVLCDYVSNNPLKSLAIAGISGLLLSKLFSNK